MDIGEKVVMVGNFPEWKTAPQYGSVGEVEAVSEDGKVVTVRFDGSTYMICGSFLIPQDVEVLEDEPEFGWQPTYNGHNNGHRPMTSLQWDIVRNSRSFDSIR